MTHFSQIHCGHSHFVKTTQTPPPHTANLLFMPAITPSSPSSSSIYLSIYISIICKDTHAEVKATDSFSHCLLICCTRGPLDVQGYLCLNAAKIYYCDLSLDGRKEISMHGIQTSCHNYTTKRIIWLLGYKCNGLSCSPCLLCRQSQLFLLIYHIVYKNNGSFKDFTF